MTIRCSITLPSIPRQIFAVILYLLLRPSATRIPVDLVIARADGPLNGWTGVIDRIGWVDPSIDAQHHAVVEPIKACLSRHMRCQDFALALPRTVSA